MTTFSIKCVLLIFLTFIIMCQSENPVTSSWAKLEISPNTLNSMEYGNFRIEIYEHAHNHKAATTASRKKYFYSPLALLDHKSAESSYNNVTKRSEMRFRVEMWSDKVQNEVVKHLNQIVSPDIKSNQVAIIPLEKVILTSNVPTEDYSLSPVWTNYDKSKILRLSLTCFDRKVCGQLANEMRSNPKQFDHLKLLYSLSSQTSQTKVTTISIDSVTSGSMVSKLLQKFGDKNEIFLTANDEKKMLTESVTNIKMETFDDSEVASPDTENQIVNILKDLLITSKTTIKDQSDKMWDSVFWNEDNYRPDKTTKTLNEILNKLDRETQKKLADLFQKAEKQSEIIEKLTSNSKDAEKRREEQIRRENQSKDLNENENRRSEATEQEQSSRNQTRDEKSKTNKVDTGFNVGFAGASFGTNVGVENSNAHNTQQENEKRENEKKNLDTQNRNLENKERIQHNYDANSWTDVDKISSTISGKLANESDSSRKVESSKEDVEKLLQESKNHVQWDGEKFVPKPMQLSRINLGKFRDSQSFQDRNVRVRYTNAELSAPIKFMEHSDLTVTDEWNNLKEQLKATSQLLNTTSGELSSVKLDLNKTRIDLEAAVMKLGEMNNEWTNKLKELLNTTVKNLGEMNNELIIVKRDLTRTTNALKGTEQELNITKIELEKTKSDFSKNVEDFSKTLNGNENELAELQIRTGNLSIELNITSMRLGHECKVNEENLRKELKATSINLETTIISNLNATRTELINAKSDVADLKTKLNDRTSEIVDIGKMPTSCSDLETMGHKLSGFFSILQQNKIKTVHCNFKRQQTDQNFQNIIGYVDIKSSAVYFHAQESDSKYAISIITFSKVSLNEGSSFQTFGINDGVFRAPVSGKYFFSFSSVVYYDALALVYLLKNDNKIGHALGQTNYQTLTLQCTVQLDVADTIKLQLFEGKIKYYRDYQMNFAGWLLEQDEII